MNQLTQITVIVIGMLSSTPVWADIPVGAFDLPITSVTKKPEKHPSRSHKLRHRRPSKPARASRQGVPHKAITPPQQLPDAVAKQPEQNKNAEIVPSTTPEKRVLASTNAVYSRYSPKIEKGAIQTWLKVQQGGSMIKSTTSKVWQQIQCWIVSVKGEF